MTWLLTVWLSVSCSGEELAETAQNSGVPILTPAAPVKPGDLVASGRDLFLMNCAHCHAADATGDEGPDLHGLVKPDAKLAALIKNGVKGEMPRFGGKFSDAEVRALVVFLDSMKQGN